MSPTSRSRIKRQKGGRAGGIDIEDLMMKCRQEIVCDSFFHILSLNMHLFIEEIIQNGR